MMSTELITWIALGLLALVALHEAAHVAVARCHGHAPLCLVVNPIGVAVLFEDAPHLGYWLLQVAVPALVTWAAAYAWLAWLFGSPAARAAGFDVDGALAHLPWTATLLTLATSGGDAVSGCQDLLRPVSGPARTERGLAALRRLPSLVLFTPYSRAHCRAARLASRAVAPTGSGPSQ